jgi:hypothetical protein
MYAQCILPKVQTRRSDDFNIHNPDGQHFVILSMAALTDDDGLKPVLEKGDLFFIRIYNVFPDSERLFLIIAIS